MKKIKGLHTPSFYIEIATLRIVILTVSYDNKYEFVPSTSLVIINIVLKSFRTNTMNTL
jgi:hypothetical protein